MRKIILAVITTSFLTSPQFLSGCGEPLPPAEPAWVTIAPLPKGCLPSFFINDGRTNGPGKMFVAVNPYLRLKEGEKSVSYGISRPQVYSFDPEENAWFLEYESPYEYGTGVITDLAFYGEVGWVTGTAFKEESQTSPFSPFLVFFDGSRWDEIDPPTTFEPWWVILRVRPINEKKAWFMAGSYSGWPEFCEGYLIKYDQGDFIDYRTLGTIRNLAYDAYNGVTYALRTDGEILLSPDEGNTWYHEKPVLSVPGYKVVLIRSIYPLGENVIITADFENGASGLLKRTGPPGQGIYEIIFLSDTSPHFFQLFDAAMDHTGRIVAVGPETSVYFDGENWYTEKLPGPTNFYSIEPAGYKGFWAIGDNMNLLHRNELLYHP